MKKFVIFQLFLASLFSNIQDELTVVTYLSSDQDKLSPINAVVLKDCRQILIVDGVRTNKKRYTAYDYIYSCNKRLYAGGSIKEIIGEIKTPYFLLHYNENAFIRKINFNGVLSTMKKNSLIKHVRFNHRNNTPGKFRDVYIDGQVGATDVPLLRVFDWVDTDHFSCVSHYQSFIIPQILWPWHVEGFISEDMQKILRANPTKHSEFGTYLYGRLGDKPYLKRGHRH